MKFVLVLIVIICECLLWRLTTSDEAARDSGPGNVQSPGGWHSRSRAHVDEILVDATEHEQEDKKTAKKILAQLIDIYHKKIRPVEKQFFYSDFGRHVMTDADIYSNPICLVVGPWSTGKSTMINFILGIEGTLQGLYTGVEPTTSDFTALTSGREYKTIEGIVMATDATKPFSATEKYGQNFLERLQGIEMPNEILERMTFIDTPGILENRKQQERGYPYNDVMRWMVNRADLIFVVFDPTKLDIGYELESLFQQLKGKESQLRIILNKADSVAADELMRVYGALFWSLAPLINVTEPPRIYVGSFWSQQFATKANEDLFLREEMSLLHDMGEVIRNRIANKIAFIRQHAIRVRIHALLVDTYVAAYRKNKGMFGANEMLAEDVVHKPNKYNIYKNILAHPNVSEYDLPTPAEYDNFFKIHPLTELKRISDYCSYLSGCATEKLEHAINHELPRMLRKYQESGTFDEVAEEVKPAKGNKGKKKAAPAPPPEPEEQQDDEGQEEVAAEPVLAKNAKAKAVEPKPPVKKDAPKAEKTVVQKEAEKNNKKKTKATTAGESETPGLLTRLNNWLDSLTPPPTHEPKKKKKKEEPKQEEGEPKNFLASLVSHIYTGPKPGQKTPREMYRLQTPKAYDKTPLHLIPGGKGIAWRIAEVVSGIFGTKHPTAGVVPEPPVAKAAEKKEKPSKTAKKSTAAEKEREEPEQEPVKPVKAPVPEPPAQKKPPAATASQPQKKTETAAQKKPEPQQTKPESQQKPSAVKPSKEKASGKPKKEQQPVKPVLPSLKKKPDTSLLTSMLNYFSGEPDPNKITAKQRYRKNRTDLPADFWEKAAEARRIEEEAAAERWRYYTSLGGLLHFADSDLEPGEKPITAYERYRKPRKDLPPDFFEKLEKKRQQEAAVPKVSYLQKFYDSLTPKVGPTPYEKYRKRRTDLPPEFWEKYEKAQALKAKEGFFAKLSKQYDSWMALLETKDKSQSGRCKYRKDAEGCEPPPAPAKEDEEEADQGEEEAEKGAKKPKKGAKSEGGKTVTPEAEEQKLNYSGILHSIVHAIQRATISESDRPCNPWHKSCQKAQGLYPEGNKKNKPVEPVVVQAPSGKKPCKPRPKPGQASAAEVPTNKNSGSTKETGNTADSKKNKKQNAKNSS